MSEILTLQLGSYANHIGSHWWNLQESSFIFDRDAAAGDETRLNHAHLWRQGQNQRGENTLTPRLIALDETSNIGNQNLSWAAYGGPHPSAIQDNDPKIRKIDQSRPLNPFQEDLQREQAAGRLLSVQQTELAKKSYDLDKFISSWTDYLRVPLHPRSLLSIPDFERSESSISTLDQGQEFVRHSNRYEDLEDLIRRFAEESDRLGGFQLLFDAEGAMGALSTAISEHLGEEYRGAPVLGLPVFPKLAFQYPVDRAHAVLNCSSWLSGLQETAAVILPLSLWNSPLSWPESTGILEMPIFQLSPGPTAYQSSAVLASALEIATSGYRSRHNPVSLAQALANVSALRTKMASLHFRSPAAVANLNHQELRESLRSLTPSSKMAEAADFASITSILRGLPGGSNVLDLESVLESSLRGVFNRSKLSLHFLRQGLIPATPFPQSVFASESPVKSLSGLALLQSSPGRPGLLKTVYELIEDPKSSMRESKRSREEINEAANALHSILCQSYDA